MEFIAVCLLLGLVCNTVGNHEDSPVSSPELVEEINTLNVGWKATVYKRFAEMKLADAKQMLGCYSAWPKDSPPKLIKNDVANDIPDSFDARSKWPNSIHPIRDQEVLSDRFAIKSGNADNVVLSAQQLVDCDTRNFGCNGGFPLKAWEYYMTEVGLLTVQCYGPYEAKDGQCKVNSTHMSQCPSGSGVFRLYKASGAHAVASIVEAIQTEIMTNGPVEASFTVYQDFFSYQSGVYVHTSGGAVGGHAIKMLGWGRSAEGVDYWICANSWGADWGMDGYFYIRRGDNECGIESGICAGNPVL